MIKLPGLIDIHVHLRDPGQTEKEDFFTGSLAALAGGFTTIIDMPNNKKPIVNLKTLKEKMNIAQKKVVSDIGFYAGSLGEDLDELMKMEPYVLGLKLYLNFTTGNYLINLDKLKLIFQAWKSEKPILLHAEEDILESVLILAKKYQKNVHVCHVSSIKEFKIIEKAKKDRINVTFGVTPHHLFLTTNHVKKLGAFALMKPIIKPGFVEFIWKNLDQVDLIESDHAPHTIKEKQSLNPPFGVPNLDTTLPLLLTAVYQSKLTLERLKELCYDNPKKILNIKTDENNYVEIDENKEYIISNKNLKTKCQWSPFAGFKIRGKIKKVILRGKTVFENDQLKVNPGYGQIITN